jgi:hypothetical protein
MHERQAQMTQANTDPRLARRSGALYLVIILCGLTAELVLRGPLLQGTPDEVAEALAGNIGLLRLSLLADTVMMVADVALALVFFVLLRRVSESLALAAMVFRLAQAVLIGASLAALASAPALITDAPRMAVHMTTLHGIGYDVGLILFAVSSGIMAVLLWRTAVPKAIAAGIGASALVYATGSMTRLLAPEWIGVIEPAYVIPMISESALCLWLLIRARI